MIHKSKQGRANINFYNCDNIEFMKSKPDNFYKLAIVDPEYGINIANRNGSIGQKKGQGKITKYKKKSWDLTPPTADYFIELFRISENQIIWGGNYFTENLPSSMGWIVYDKHQPEGVSFAMAELAFTSFDISINVFKTRRSNMQNCISNNARKGKASAKIHPTQKPVQLYKWLLTNYAKPNDNILDTHGGSASIALACWDLGFDLDLCELDEDYFNDSWKRFETHSRQQQLF